MRGGGRGRGTLRRKKLQKFQPGMRRCCSDRRTSSSRWDVAASKAERTPSLILDRTSAHAAGFVWPTGQASWTHLSRLSELKSALSLSRTLPRWKKPAAGFFESERTTWTMTHSWFFLWEARACQSLICFFAVVLYSSRSASCRQCERSSFLLAKKYHAHHKRRRTDAATVCPARSPGPEKHSHLSHLRGERSSRKALEWCV